MNISSCRLSAVAVAMALAGTGGQSAFAQSVPLPPALKRCYDMHHGKAADVIPDAEIQSCYPIAFAFAQRRGWVSTAAFYEFAGHAGSINLTAFYSEFRLPGPIECKLVFDGHGYSFRGEIERVYLMALSRLGMGRLPDPLDRQRKLANGYQVALTPCAIGVPGNSMRSVEQQLARIATGPAAFQCREWGRGACDDRQTRTGRFRTVTGLDGYDALLDARAASYVLILKMLQ